MSDGRLDGKIDEVAREMTRGELPPDFRARVITRLESGNERPWTWQPAWVLAPLAVAAVVLLAFLAGRAPRQLEVRVAQETRHEAAGGDVPLTPAASDTIRPKPDTADGKIGSARASALAADASDEGRSDLAPGPIEIESLEATEAMDIAPLRVDAMESIDVPGLGVAPLEVPAIGEQ
jgi:hypothetical protein